MSVEKRLIEAPYMNIALRREASDEIVRLRAALAQSIQMCSEHRDGRLAAREENAVLKAALAELIECEDDHQPRWEDRIVAAFSAGKTALMHNAEFNGGL